MTPARSGAPTARVHSQLPAAEGGALIFLAAVLHALAQVGVNLGAPGYMDAIAKQTDDIDVQVCVRGACSNKAWA